MSHLALYRQFRPRTFDEMVGQTHITTTLKNQIKTGNIGHAYLFCGSRGTGKTTAARVFARAVNCEHSIDGNPCMKCKSCIDQGVDIIELDAASNNGVDYIRDIKEKASFSPINGRYKIYIVDEVHMLSVNAFNAFLKILEEPPSFAIFVLCTTEPQKIPQTILSRCMRFDFRLVGMSDLTQLLSGILKQVNKTASEQAINAICTAGDGSFRDTLSIADRCLAFVEDKPLEYDDVMNILGSTDTSSVDELVVAILSGDISKILITMQTITEAGKNVMALARDITVLLRNILVCQTVPSTKQLLALPDYRYEKLKNISESFSSKKVLFALSTFAKMENDLHFALNPKVFLETIALRVATNSGEVDTDALEARISRLEKKIEDLIKNTSVAVSSNQPVLYSEKPDLQQELKSSSLDKLSQNNKEEKLLPKEKVSISKPISGKTSKSMNIQLGMEIWGRILTVLRAQCDEFLVTICENVEKVFIEGEFTLVIQAKSGTFAILNKSDNFAKIQSILSGFSTLHLEVRPFEEKDTWDQSLQQFKSLAGEVPLFVDGKKIN